MLRKSIDQFTKENKEGEMFKWPTLYSNDKKWVELKLDESGTYRTRTKLIEQEPN